MKTATVGGIYSESKFRFKLTNIREPKHYRGSSWVKKEIGISSHAKSSTCHEINKIKTTCQVRILHYTYHNLANKVKATN